ncbi:MAG TPA: heavy-metal-associated domain-containing protein [Amycolatopsis sp.]|jgi:copper chaperone|nr:heavy-metal-associated domain-containing protein [Amycolatopsis sp.]
MIENAYTVTGMSCGHCAQSVTEELSAIAGVQEVKVNVETGRVVVLSEGNLAEGAVRAAVEEAGYTYEGAVAPV